MIPDLPPSQDEQGYSLDGYEWMDRLPEGWHAYASWGRDGWDLGDWPYSIVVLYDNPQAQAFAHGVYTEGDIEVTRHASEAELHGAVNAIALWYWRHHPHRGPPDLPGGRQCAAASPWAVQLGAAESRGTKPGIWRKRASVNRNNHYGTTTTQPGRRTITT